MNKIKENFILALSFILVTVDYIAVMLELLKDKICTQQNL